MQDIRCTALIRRLSACAVQDKLVKTIVANYILWPGAHFINFRFVPSEHRILYNNCVSVRFLFETPGSSFSHPAWLDPGRIYAEKAFLQLLLPAAAHPRHTCCASVMKTSIADSTLTLAPQVVWNAYLSTLSHDAAVVDTTQLLGLLDQAQGLLDAWVRSLLRNLQAWRAC